jgi:hypothetical protein
MIFIILFSYLYSLTIITISSAYALTVSYLSYNWFFISTNSSSIYNMNSLGDSLDPYGVPWVIFMDSYDFIEHL